MIIWVFNIFGQTGGRNLIFTKNQLFSPWPFQNFDFLSLDIKYNQNNGYGKETHFPTLFIFLESF
jgi:hypothetical protein